MAQKIDWPQQIPNRLFLKKIKEDDYIPFIGPETCKPWIPVGKDIASRWAKEYDYPLPDSYQLSGVAQFLAIKEGNKESPKALLSTELKKKQSPYFYLDEFRYTPPAVLALKSRGKELISDFCIWSEIHGI